MRSLAPCLVAVLISGCTDTSNRYPSLLPRPIETRTESAPSTPALAAAPDPALDSRISALVAPLAKADIAFRQAADLAEARAATAAGAAQGTSAWLDAQSALMAAEAARAPTINAIADLEAIAIDRGVKGLPAYPALESALTQARAQDDAEQRRITTLQAAVGAS